MKALLVTLVLLASVPVRAAEFHPFVRGSWRQLKSMHAGRPTIVSFWSISCAPCLAEMPLWRQLMRHAANVDIVLVSTDAISNAKLISERIDGAGLARADNWAFADRFTDRLYFEVNPHWQGVLPYTVLIGRTGRTIARVGEADPAKLKDWIASQKG